MIQYKCNDPTIENLANSSLKTMDEFKVYILESHLIPLYRSKGFKNVKYWTGKQKKSYLNFDILEMIITPIYMVIFQLIFMQGAPLDGWGD